MKRKYLSLTVTSLMLLGSVVVASANQPPPPVNQNIGIKDGVFDNMHETDCRGCHDGKGTNGTQAKYLPDRHHLKVGKAYSNPTDAPNVSVSGPVVSGAGGTYECLDCHTLVIGTTGKYEFAPFRNCLLCHWQDGNTERFASVHHRSEKAVKQLCKECHGPIDALTDNHVIPTYGKSAVTPETDSGLSPVKNTAGKGQGGCAFCHYSGTDTATAFGVYTNMDTHHGTGLVKGPYTLANQSAACLLCHDWTPELADPNNNNIITPFKIRACEKCHGINSLHNIAYDSTNDGKITPGKENPWFSHVGAQNDCMGCHGGFAAAYTMESEVCTAPAPTLDGLVDATMRAGSNKIVAGVGKAIDSMMPSIVMLTENVTGAVSAYVPAAQDADSVVFGASRALAAGTYKVKLVKATVQSGAQNLNVTPAMDISKAVCNIDQNGWAAVRIMGQNFGPWSGGMSLAASSGTGFSVSGDGTGCGIVGWSDTMVSATCGRTCPSVVDVQNLFEKDSAPVNQANNCAKCHRDSVTATCATMASHDHKNYLTAGEAKAALAAANLTCTTATTNPKVRARK